MLVEEKQLWQAVILQAVLDLSGTANRAGGHNEQILTARWFNVRNKDFVEVCDRAGWCPDWVVRNMKTGSFLKNKVQGFKSLRRGGQ